LLAAFALAAVAPELVRMDVAEHRLPNRLTVPALLAGVAGAGVSCVATGAPPFVPLVAGLACGGLLFLLALAGGMGMGDVKLATAIGLASPTLTVAVAAPLLAFLFGGVASLMVLVRAGWSARKQHIAFGPFLLAGYFATLGLAAVARLG
jgi:leader peptidase (prepilin peptidase)/N-methyltransferase